jgi:hypothetical protein
MKCRNGSFGLFVELVTQERAVYVEKRGLDAAGLCP